MWSFVNPLNDREIHLFERCQQKREKALYKDKTHKQCTPNPPSESRFRLWHKCQNQNIRHTLAFVPPHSLRRRALGERKERRCVYADFLGHATKGAGEIAGRQPLTFATAWGNLALPARACRQLLGIVRFLSGSAAAQPSQQQQRRPGVQRQKTVAASGGLSTKYQSPGGCAN